MMKRVLLDADECCLSWVDGFKEFAQKHLDRELPSVPDQFDVSKWLGVTKEESIDMIRQFNNHEDGFGKLKPMHKAEVYLPKLNQKGFELIVITACSDEESTKQRRVENLKNVFGDIFAHIHCTKLTDGSSKSKKPFLEMYPPCVWIEDKVDNALVGVEAGHRAILIRNHHSVAEQKQHSDLDWVDSWEDVYRDLLTLRRGHVIP